MQGGAKLTLVCIFLWQETTHHVVCAQVSRISPELLTAIDKGFFSMAEPLGQARNKASAREHAATWETERTKYHYDHWDAFEVLYTQFCVHLSARLNGDENFESEDEDGMYVPVPGHRCWWELCAVGDTSGYFAKRRTGPRNQPHMRRGQG